MEKKFHDLSKRFVSYAVIVAVLTLLIVFCMQPVVQVVITLVAAAFAGVGAWEFIGFLRAKQIDCSRKPLIAFAVLELISFYFALTFSWGSQLPIVVMFLAAFVFFFVHFNKLEGSLISVASQVFGLCYIVVPIGLMLKILYPELLHNFAIQDGRLWFVYLIVVTKITDIGAYFGGKLWGNKKLAPVLSPKKTWVGLFCGVFIATVTSLIFAICGMKFRLHSVELSIVWSIVLGILIGFFGQLGDLAESLLKRDAGVSDSGVIPGMGGVLDLIDSLLFTAPVVYFYLHTV